MRKMVIAAVFAVFGWMTAAPVSASEQSAASSRFCADPMLQVYSGESDIWYFILPEGPRTIRDNGMILLVFTVTAAQTGQWGHSSVLGPIPVGADWADFRFNLHYDSEAFQVSIFTNEGGLGQRYAAQVGTTYQAVFVHQGSQLIFQLYDGSVAVFEDSLTYSWPTFDRFQVAYDYYGSGYCTWNEPYCRIDFLSNRGTERWLYGAVEDLVFDYVVPVQPLTWGRVKAAYR
ncbi:MAG: hypothetical protein QME74_03875 [Candidatus Edwardsbacteria bacterium]|nr:hypothetical protein [Candidatus Edwardsbacteria bacterium]